MLCFSETAGPIDPGSNKGRLADFLKKNGYHSPVYTTENSSRKFHSSVTVRIPYLWAVENPIRGKGKAEHGVARVILDKINDSTLSGKSEKETLKTCSDRKGIQQPKYYPIQSWSNQQDYIVSHYLRALKIQKACEYTARNMILTWVAKRGQPQWP